MGNVNGYEGEAERKERSMHAELQYALEHILADSYMQRTLPTSIKNQKIQRALANLLPQAVAGNSRQSRQQ